MNFIKKIVILNLFILSIIYLPCMAGPAEKREKWMYNEGHYIDVGKIKGKIIQVRDDDSEVRVDFGTENFIWYEMNDRVLKALKFRFDDEKYKQLISLNKRKFSGEEDLVNTLTNLNFLKEKIKIIVEEARCRLDPEKDKDKRFTVIRNNIPIATIKLYNIGQNDSLCKIVDILDNIILQTEDLVTSEEIELDQGDLKFFNNPYGELISKTRISDGNLYYRWNKDFLSSDIIGNMYLLACTTQKGGTVGAGSLMAASAAPFVPYAAMFSLLDYGGGAQNNTYMYGFDEKGGKKWGYVMGANVFNYDGVDYKVSGDKGYFNTFSLSQGGIIFGLNLRTGEELWRLKDPVAGTDPAFYGHVYDNFADNICYLYSSKSSLYSADLTKGQFLWEFEMKGNGLQHGVFDEKKGSLYATDAKGYFYKINSKDGKELWKVKIDAPVIKLDEKGNIFYLFDSKQSIYALDNEKGKIIWKYKAENDFSYPFMNKLMGDEILTFDNDYIVKISSTDGKIIWKREIERAYPLLYNGTDTLYCTSGNNKIYAVNTGNGSPMWVYEHENDMAQVVPVNNSFYIIDDDTINIISMAGGEVILKKEFPQAMFLSKQQVIDPYNIKALSQDEKEKGLIFLFSYREKTMMSIDPNTNQINLEQKYENPFTQVISDGKRFYLATENHIWAIDKVTGQTNWDKGYENNIGFIPAPADGEVLFASVSAEQTMSSNSKKLLNFKLDNDFYSLNKDTGDLVLKSNIEENSYPCMELEAMSKAGEKMEGLNFYFYNGYVYIIKGKS